MTDRELMQMALDALEWCYDVTEWPANGKSAQDKAIEALRARLAQPEQEIDPDRPHVEEDGCPTEKAVLQRFWREHQMQEPVFWATNTLAHEWMVTKEKVANDSIPLYTAPPQQPERKLWLWKNFVDGRPEYWAFDNPYPTNLDNGDPQTLGQPCGYAIFKPSRDGSRGRTEEQVLREMESVFARSEREWQGLTDEEIKQLWKDTPQLVGVYSYTDIAREVEAKLKEKNT